MVAPLRVEAGFRNVSGDSRDSHEMCKFSATRYCDNRCVTLVLERPARSTQ
jgi:hypothetical protein